MTRFRRRYTFTTALSRVEPGGLRGVAPVAGQEHAPFFFPRSEAFRGVAVPSREAFRIVEAERGPAGSGQPRLRTRAEEVVPIVSGRSPALDGGMESDHGLRHGFTGRVGVEATVDGMALLQEGM